MHVLCDVHRTSLAHGKTFTLLDEKVRGMVRCALSLRNGAALSRFPRCLTDGIASMLQTIPGRPPVEAVTYKKAALRLFVAHGKISLSAGAAGRSSNTREPTWSPRRTATTSSPT